MPGNPGLFMERRYPRLGFILAACLLAYLAISMILSAMPPGGEIPVTPSPGPAKNASRDPTEEKVPDTPLVLGQVKNQTVIQGNSLKFTLNRTDLGGRILVYEAGLLPPGALFFPGNRTMKWTPDSSQSGIFTLHFTARNGSLVASQKVFITVKKGEALPDPVNMTLKHFLGLAGRVSPASRGYPDGFTAARLHVVHPKESIQAAIDEADDGDAVIVEKGTYPERVVVKKSLTLWGRGNPVIDGEGGGCPLSIAVDGARVDGFTLRNSGSSPYASGIRIYSNRNIVANNTCTGNQYGISLSPPADGNIIIGNWILNSSRSGISIPHSRNVEVRANTIVNNRMGIEVEMSWYLTLTENTVSLNAGDGIGLRFSHANQLANNIVVNNKGAGILLSQGGKNRITGNYIGKNSGNGVETRDFSDSFLKGNQIVASLDSLSLNVIEENTVKGQNGHGIVANRSSNLIDGNEVGFNRYGIYFIQSQNLARNNTLRGNTFGIYLLNSGNSTLVMNAIQNNANGIKVDGNSGNNELISNLIADNRGDGLILAKSTEQNTIMDNLIANNTGTGFTNLGKNIIGNNLVLNNTRNERYT